MKIHSTSSEQIKEQVEQSILDCERVCRKRKKPSLALPKGKAKAKVSLPDHQVELEQGLLGLEDMQTDSEDENFKACCFIHVGKMKYEFVLSKELVNIGHTSCRSLGVTKKH